jgi:hypothetical protein
MMVLLVSALLTPSFYAPAELEDDAGSAICKILDDLDAGDLPSAITITPPFVFQSYFHVFCSIPSQSAVSAPTHERAPPRSTTAA